ncbi:hypothetical protein BCR33DRAFT_767428 [Rhizoclosmatium globosum]|uniref:5-hmdU DNA kinase helical domain-containing protein n=1 Tax=Rhizoclosmatium globosum TaxID=329046 RepID=A0A1Y2C3P8_9FUNG|nr:hypothetical protein BCR33DRAFT_767428 [Rhizoclosmatium globosum]|eukprot:ORY41576.1 hypothetical protein BCR33DRAFT_767428 [Rhizoclosmatium globosum]
MTAGQRLSSSRRSSAKVELIKEEEEEEVPIKEDAESDYEAASPAKSNRGRSNRPAKFQTPLPHTNPRNIPNWDEIEWLCRYVEERHRIYLRKSAGLPGPWTRDPILGGSWRSGNVHRADDPQTREYRAFFAGRETRPDFLFNFWIHELLLSWKWIYEPGFGYFTSLASALSKFKEMMREGRRFRPTVIQACYNDASLLKAIRYNWKYSVEKSKKFFNKPVEKRSQKEFYQMATGLKQCGDFHGYQMVGNAFMFGLLPESDDWAAMGPGAKKGLGMMGFTASHSNLMILLRLVNLKFKEWSWGRSLAMEKVGLTSDVVEHRDSYRVLMSREQIELFDKHEVDILGNIPIALQLFNLEDALCYYQKYAKDLYNLDEEKSIYFKNRYGCRYEAWENRNIKYEGTNVDVDKVKEEVKQEVKEEVKKEDFKKDTSLALFREALNTLGSTFNHLKPEEFVYL